MRSIDDLTRVLLPTLRGEYMLAMLGNGYGGASMILARSTDEFLREANGLLADGFDVPIAEPCRVRIVSFSDTQLAAMRDAHAARMHEILAGMVGYELGNYVKLLGSLPCGFERVDERPDAIPVPSDDDVTDTYVEWRGEGTLRERFASQWRDDFDAPRGVPSAEPPSSGDVRIVWSGERRENPCVDTFDGSCRAMVDGVPAFACDVLEPMPELLAAIVAAREAKEAEERTHKAQCDAGRNVSQAKLDAENVERYLRVYGPPSGAP